MRNGYLWVVSFLTVELTTLERRLSIKFFLKSNTKILCNLYLPPQRKQLDSVSLHDHHSLVSDDQTHECRSNFFRDLAARQNRGREVFACYAEGSWNRPAAGSGPDSHVGASHVWDLSTSVPRRGEAAAARVRAESESRRFIPSVIVICHF